MEGTNANPTTVRSPAAAAADGHDRTSHVLQVRGLTVVFPDRNDRSRVHHAVDDISLDLDRGEALGIVGESGSGKTTLGRAVLGLISIASGSILIEGKDVRTTRGSALRSLRRKAQIIFQDPGGSLNPRMRIAEVVSEPLQIHRVGDRRQRRAAAITLLERCGMPSDAADRLPHQLSGGQRQRVAIARALTLEPALIVCDEPTSALDVSVQAQILNLLSDLRAERGLSYLFISHDIAVVSHLCNRIAVMRAGAIVETGATESVLSAPSHEYTRQLLSAVPSRDLAPS